MYRKMFFEPEEVVEFETPVEFETLVEFVSVVVEAVVDPTQYGPSVHVDVAVV